MVGAAVAGLNHTAITSFSACEKKKSANSAVKKNTACFLRTHRLNTLVLRGVVLVASSFERKCVCVCAIYACHVCVSCMCMCSFTHVCVCMCVCVCVLN